VPENLAIELITTRLKEADCSSQGWILDRFPRSLAEAKALEGRGIQVNRLSFTF
jgi:adenylate kinase family enzyme